MERPKICTGWYFFGGRLLGVDSFENWRSDLGSNIAQIAVFLKVLHDQVFEFVELFHF